MFKYHKTSGRLIRFGLQGVSGLASPLWRMWVQGDETYLAMRGTEGLSKISLHSSGQWMLSAGTSRFRIKGPRRLNQKWKVGPRIVFPGIHPNTRLPIYDRCSKKACFLFREPLVHYWRDFAVLFSVTSAQPDEVGSLMPQNAELIGPLPLRNHGCAWLATFAGEMTAREIDYVNSERAKFVITVTEGIEKMPAPWANLVQHVENGDTMIVNIGLGRENIRLASEASESR